MNVIQKFLGGFSAKPQKRYYDLAVKCLRCGEVIESRVDLANDLSVEYEDGGDVYYARKVLLGNSMCFQRVEVELKFKSTRELIGQNAIGGDFG